MGGMSLPTSVAAVIFDNDGTLVDSMAGIIRSWVQWCEEHGADPRRLQDLHGMSSKRITATLAPAGTDLAMAHRRIDELEVEHAYDTVPQPGALDAIAAMPEGRYAVASSGTRAVVNARLAAAGITAPEVVVSSDDVTHAKPDPEIFRVACERLGVEPADCLVVEDAVAGVRAGLAAGCPVLAVTTTYPREAVLEAGATAVVDRLDEVRFSVDDEGRIRISLD